MAGVAMALLEEDIMIVVVRFESCCDSYCLRVVMPSAIALYLSGRYSVLPSRRRPLTGGRSFRLLYSTGPSGHLIANGTRIYAVRYTSNGTVRYESLRGRLGGTGRPSRRPVVDRPDIPRSHAEYIPVRNYPELIPDPEIPRSYTGPEITPNLYRIRKNPELIPKM